MNKQLTTCASGALSRLFKAIFLGGITLAFILMCGIQTSQAGSATWNLNPKDYRWNNFSNWSPMTVPNGYGDIATFDMSNTTDLSLSAGTIVAAVVFNPGASAYRINLSAYQLSILEGVNNNSGITQTFDIPSLGCLGGSVSFRYNSTAGNATTYIAGGGPGCPPFGVGGSYIYFFESSSADHATFIVDGGTKDGVIGGGGNIIFFATSSAGSGTFRINPAKGDVAYAGRIGFNGGSTASNGTFTNYGGYAGKAGGSTYFAGNSDAGNATLIAKTGFNGGAGGSIAFHERSTGGTARVEVFGNGNLDISRRTAALTIGSIEGSGQVFLWKNNLRVGTNNLNTKFYGVISDSGALIKIGAGKLILGNANSYSGSTIVNNGKLVVSNTSGSAAGTGAVQVNAGMLRGHGIIAGSVTIGKGNGRGAVLSPGNRLRSSATLTIQSTLTFNADASYHFSLRSHAGTEDEVVANGVTINSGAQFSFTALGDTTLTPGSVYTVINNTSASAISGTFSNLPDGSTFTVNGNTFKANYEGGDGNDLILTVVP